MAAMKFVCDAPGGSWFRIETEAEADAEASAMNHAVAKHFRRAREAAKRNFKPASTIFIESNIGLEAHIQRHMPLFLSLKDGEGCSLVTAMLPPGGAASPKAEIIIVGRDNADPYPDHGPSIEALGRHFGLGLDRARCYPYRR